MKKILLASFLLISFLLSGCVGQNSSNQSRLDQDNKDSDPNLKFSVHSCVSDSDPEIISLKENQTDENWESGIVSQEWIDDETILIQAYVLDACGGCSIDGDFEIKDNNIILKYISNCGGEDNEIPGPITGCLCYKIVNYEISSLEKIDYFITIETLF